MKAGRGYILSPQYPFERFETEEDVVAFIRRNTRAYVSLPKVFRAIRDHTGLHGIHFYRVKIGDPVEIPVFVKSRELDPGFPAIVEAPDRSDFEGSTIQSRKSIRRMDTGDVYPSCNYAARMILGKNGRPAPPHSRNVSKLRIALARAACRGDRVDGTKWQWSQASECTVSIVDQRKTLILRFFPDGKKVTYDSFRDAAEKSKLPEWKIKYILKTTEVSSDGSRWQKLQPNQQMQLAGAA